MDDRSPSKAQSPGRTSEAATALVHLYRGELGRMTSYRQRLDTTTNWAISFAGATVTLVLGTEAIPHGVALMMMIPTVAFLVLEASRFRNYEISRNRVRLFERGYFPEVLSSQAECPWVDALMDQLRNPRPPLDMVTAIGWRLRRLYLWIYFVMLGAWLLKLELVGGPTGDLGALLSRASIGPLSGWAVLGGVLVLFAVLTALAAWSVHRYPQGDEW